MLSLQPSSLLLWFLQRPNLPQRAEVEEEAQKDAAGCPAKRSFISPKEKAHALLSRSDKKENQIKCSTDVLSSFVKADKNY